MYSVITNFIVLCSHRPKNVATKDELSSRFEQIFQRKAVASENPIYDTKTSDKFHGADELEQDDTPLEVGSTFFYPSFKREEGGGSRKLNS